MILVGNEFSARDAYLNKNYKLAKNQYKSLVKESPNNISFQYNLGATYYRLNDLINAKIHFLKALKQNPNNKDILFNLKIINKNFIDQDLFFDTHWNQIVGWPMNLIMVLMLLCSIPLLLVTIFLLKTKKVKIIKRPMIILGVLWTASLIVVITLNMKQPRYGLVTTKKISIFSGPSETQKKLFYVHEGTEFKILKSTKTWHQIQFSNGLKGWIEGINIISI